MVPLGEGHLRLSRLRVQRTLPSRAKPPGTRQPAPATTTTSAKAGRRRSAAGTPRRITQFLQSRGRMRGRPIKRTLRGTGEADSRGALRRRGTASRSLGRMERGPAVVRRNWSPEAARSYSSCRLRQRSNARSAARAKHRETNEDEHARRRRLRSPPGATPGGPSGLPSTLSNPDLASPPRQETLGRCNSMLYPMAPCRSP